MKSITAFLALILLVVSCNTAPSAQQEQATKKVDSENNEPDFRTYTWNETQANVIEKELPKQAKVYDSEGIVQLEFEGDFLGVTTNLDENCVARMTCFFADKKLKGGWYYIYTKKELFDMDKKVQEIFSDLAKPSQTIEKDEAATKVYLWEMSTKAVKVLARNTGDFVRFEWYIYEKTWFDANKALVASEFGTAQ